MDSRPIKNETCGRLQGSILGLSHLARSDVLFGKREGGPGSGLDSSQVWSLLTSYLANKKEVLVQLGAIHPAVIPTPACRPRGDMVQKVHRLLADPGASFPVHCLPFNANVSFPRSALSNGTANGTKCERPLRTLYECLQGAEQVFKDNDIAEREGGVPWDKHKLDRLRHLRYRLVVEDDCMSALGESARFSSYFRSVSALVRQQDSATCGWSVLRRDLLWLLKTLLDKHHRCFSW
ncbi:uncharacterized protein [Nerophis lumbriciformis]|uniref:uncharacterized protein n=1 Tax=Nerophis lumbriciformis TaxID=546530 RepID=UPI002ADF9FBA|nr:uncharacterized protein LOC133620695 [Nerophis lumbriciformis]